jgi:hypothetical protein
VSLAWEVAMRVVLLGVGATLLMDLRARLPALLVGVGTIVVPLLILQPSLLRP